MCLAVLVAGSAVACLAAEPLTFRQAIEQAVRHSGTMAIAVADQTEAHQNYLETRNAFLPTVTLGSGLAATYGFPMSLEGSAPTVINVTTQQYLINPAQNELLRAAKTEWKATSTALADKRAQVILETALTYSELDKLTSEVNVLREQQQSADKVLSVANLRVEAGVDNELELARAKLNIARTDLRIQQAMGQADALRMRLAQLTGLSADSIVTSTESIPELPLVNYHEASTEPQSDAVDAKIVDNNPLVQAAMQKALAAEQRAKAEHKMMYPQVDLAGQYGRFEKYNNYDLYFQRFQHNNASFGLEMRLPLLNFSQKAKAEAADAAAVRAQRQADDVKNQVSMDALKQQRALKQLAAAREVARLEYLLARADVNAVGIKLTAGTANVRDEEKARLQQDDKYVTFLDANFDLEKAQMQLMKTTGELENWATSGK
jgi:outer membrane protein TolC